MPPNSTLWGITPESFGIATEPHDLAVDVTAWVPRKLAAAIPAAVDHALSLSDSERQVCTPMLAILSAQHEQQYSRLFRS